ncbi:HAMP domain-containing sensor histidine kinase [Microcoleus sp. FACHB-1515]|uniref:sensor histidine kinase n=1 Tax=Cyanophyceae TaxID=3028117 RepID=UPI001F557CE3|nr:HAMP domain-containing sensor histidine kinase [Microcoleus sp. FACHB-1515]
MTLWKRFTGWGIGSTQRSRGLTRRRSPFEPPQPASPQFRSLAWQLLLSYLGAMTAILSISTIAVYQFVAHSLYQQLDQQLVVLADAAAHSLPAIASGQLQTQLPRSIDNDGDLDLPWQELREDHQSVEWFNSQRRLLGRAGRYFPSHAPGTSFQTWQQDQVRTLTIPVYVENSQQVLQGYVRVSESIEDEAAQLKRLLMGMAWGGLIAALLVGVSGWWLTRRSLRPIEQNVRQLQQFTADASHELRSPLTAIRTAVEVMQSHPERVHPADTKKVAAIASATQQMSRLVEDLLLLARTGAAADAAKLLIPLDELLEDLITAFQTEAAAKAIALNLNSLPEIQIQGDAAQLRRIFANLLENALQYTPAGGSITVAIEAGTSGQVRIQVIDTGIGIAPDQLPFVFDRFWRADRVHPTFAVSNSA